MIDVLILTSHLSHSHSSSSNHGHASKHGQVTYVNAGGEGCLDEYIDSKRYYSCLDSMGLAIEEDFDPIALLGLTPPTGQPGGEWIQGE